ncbi:MAG: hypothetical protein ACAH81_11600 [Actinomycetota bacterium]
MEDPKRPAGRWFRSRGSKSGSPASDEPSVEPSVEPPVEADIVARVGADMPVDAPAPVAAAAPADDAAMALVEVAHERDVSIARASEAEERERLIRDRLASLAPLERRVEDAERRVRDAERRLDEISARIEAATRGEIAPALGASPEPAGHDDAEPQSSEPTDDVARQAADLRDRLARTAARKRAARDGR